MDMPVSLMSIDENVQVRRAGPRISQLSTKQLLTSCEEILNNLVMNARTGRIRTHNVSQNSCESQEIIKLLRQKIETQELNHTLEKQIMAEATKQEAEKQSKKILHDELKVQELQHTAEIQKWAKEVEYLKKLIVDQNANACQMEKMWKEMTNGSKNERHPTPPR